MPKTPLVLPSPAHRTAALARAERGSAPVTLSSVEKRLLDRALEQGQDLHDRMQTAVLEFGRWLLVEVFESKASSALDDKTENPVWLELVRRAGGPTLGVSRRMLYVALAIAANDKRLTDESWRLLDVQRKEMLLPLREPASLRQAAQHVTRFDLTQQMTREYVSELLSETGKKRQLRLTRAGLLSRVRRARESLAGAAVVHKTRELAQKLSDKERAEVRREVQELLATVQGLARALR